jgi:hypothetical protein
MLINKYSHNLQFLNNLQPTEVFRSYWKFAAERHAIYLKRLKGEPSPWTTDSILQEHKFTNVFRAADRVSQYCIKEVIYEGGSMEPEELVFRILLFKLFNSIPAWQVLTTTLGPLTWKSFNATNYGDILGKAKARGVKIWNAAYMQKPQTGSDLVGKHNNYLNLLERMMRSGITEKLRSASSYWQAYSALRTFPSPAMGDFTAMQLLTDINYSTVINFDEDDFIMPGSGCLRGIQKCFGLPQVSVSDAQSIIYQFVDEQEVYFKGLKCEPVTLFGRKLHAIDVQNLFCETDKYARAAHPEFKLKDGERIKQTFKQAGPFPPTFFPPKWNLVVRL